MPARIKRTLLVYKLAIVRFALFVVQTLCGSIMAALAGTQWSSADGQTKFLIVVGIVASLTATLGAFFDKTLSKLSPDAAALVGIAVEPETVSAGPAPAETFEKLPEDNP